MNRRFLVFASLLLVLVASCAQAQEAKQAPKDPPPVSQAGKQDNPVFVRLLGESITDKEVPAAIDDLARRNQLPSQQMQRKNTLFIKSEAISF